MQALFTESKCGRIEEALYHPKSPYGIRHREYRRDTEGFPVTRSQKAAQIWPYFLLVTRGVVDSDPLRNLCQA